MLRVSPVIADNALFAAVLSHQPDLLAGLVNGRTDIPTLVLLVYTIKSKQHRLTNYHEPVSMMANLAKSDFDEVDM